MSSGHYCDGCAQAYYKCVCGKTNERIKELAEEHGFIHEFMTTGERRDALQKYEKFAELIVQECVRICKDNGESYQNHMNLSSDLIKQHFGVEP